MWLLSHDIKVCDSDLLEGMTNWHCHLLPGVDDGVSAVCETNKILKLWETMGMKEVWLTPHIMEEIPNKTAYLKNQYKQLQEQVKDSRIRLHLAAENMLDNEFQHRLAKEDLLTLGSQNQVLVETSYYNPPMGMKRILNEDLIYEILSVVEEIPEGKVATYGQIARLTGRDRNARLVGKILSMSEYYGKPPRCQFGRKVSTALQ